MLKIIDPTLLGRMAEFANSAKTCPPPASAQEDACPEGRTCCTIEMKVLRHENKDYCVAVAPDVNIKTEPLALTRRLIVWKLSRDSLPGDGVDKILVFHDAAGVLLTSNQDQQVDAWGRIGDGTPGNANKRRFHTWTWRRKLGASATYLPVVLWGPPGMEELCAAVDPKIVNRS